MPSCFESLNNDPPSSFSYLIGVRIYETYCSPYIRYSKPKNTKPAVSHCGFCVFKHCFPAFTELDSSVSDGLYLVYLQFFTFSLP